MRLVDAGLLGGEQRGQVRPVAGGAHGGDGAGQLKGLETLQLGRPAIHPQDADAPIELPQFAQGRGGGGDRWRGLGSQR